VYGEIFGFDIPEEEEWVVATFLRYEPARDEDTDTDGQHEWDDTDPTLFRGLVTALYDTSAREQKKRREGDVPPDSIGEAGRSHQASRTSS